jgi:hypothetical protein
MGELLSSVEAILQNILGADNILVPPGSQVEEILQAIYYNTEYENNPKSRVAEILLAIKNQGIYDGPVLSRMEDILVHKLNNIPYTKHKKEDLSRIEQLLLDWLEQGGGEEIIEYTGTFPMTILANGEPLLDYIISGNTVQSGTPTPDSPIMPEGTGDVETSGGKAGQYKIPISSANITTPVYLGEVETTRKVRKLVLTGNERLLNEGLAAGYYRYRVYLTQLSDADTDDVLSSHYPTAKVTNPQSEAITKPLTVTQFVRLYTLIPSLDDFKVYLAAQYANGTPVTIWYILAEPETGIVNEPLMKIGDYADTLSMEQAGVDVPTNKKPTETVIDVPTSVKPSEGYIKYAEPADGPTPKTQVLGTKNHEIYVTPNNEIYVLRR